MLQIFLEDYSKRWVNNDFWMYRNGKDSSDITSTKELIHLQVVLLLCTIMLIYHKE